MNDNLPTLGVEEEYQIVDPTTWALAKKTDRMIEEGRQLYGEHIRPEFHAPVVEVVTGVCRSVAEVGEQLRMFRRILSQLAKKQGLALAAASTHPFTHWKEVEVTQGPRYMEILQDMQDVVRANLIYGLHVHVGIPDPEARIAVMNAARYFLPHILALSASSPLWQGRRTGLLSTRTAIFRRLPRTGVPDYFNNWAEFESYVKLLVETRCIDNAKKIYWDVRPHPFFPTIEFRICDMPGRIDDTLAIVALIQAFSLKLLRLYHGNMGYRLYRRALIAENIWRAARFGLDGKFIDFLNRREIPVRDAIRELLDFVAEDVRILNCEREIAGLFRILEENNSAARQLRTFEETGDLSRVVQRIVQETEEGI